MLCVTVAEQLPAEVFRHHICARGFGLDYTGNVMSGCNSSLDGSVTLGADGSPLAWDFSDGRHEFTQANSTGTIDAFYLLSDHNGSPFRDWALV